VSSPRCVTRRKGRTVLNPRRIRKIRRRRRRRRAAAASADPSNRRRRHHCWGSTRVFSPLFCVGEGGEEESSLLTKIKFFYTKRGVVASFFCPFFTRRRGRLSLFKTWLKFRFLGCTTANKQTRQKKHRAYIKMSIGKKRKFQKTKKHKRTPFVQRSRVFCVSFLRTLPSFFVQRPNKDTQETESGRRA